MYRQTLCVKISRLCLGHTLVPSAWYSQGVNTQNIFQKTCNTSYVNPVKQKYVKIQTLLALY